MGKKINESLYRKHPAYNPVENLLGFLTPEDISRLNYAEILEEILKKASQPVPDYSDVLKEILEKVNSSAIPNKPHTPTIKSIHLVKSLLKSKNIESKTAAAITAATFLFVYACGGILNPIESSGKEYPKPIDFSQPTPTYSEAPDFSKTSLMAMNTYRPPQTSSPCITPLPDTKTHTNIKTIKDTKTQADTKTLTDTKPLTNTEIPASIDIPANNLPATEPPLVSRSNSLPKIKDISPLLELQNMDSSELEKLSKEKLFMTATAYDLSYKSCSKTREHPAYGITASGSRATVGRTIAVDPNIIPLESSVYISFPEEYKHLDGVYIAEDTGSLIKGNKIDVFFGEDNPGESIIHNKAYEFGLRLVEVYLLD